ncbi:WhiB family transcriptional regulator [Streptomyces bobili]|uniref:WhiB family transcriptional regulator n=1 Tax=Streptomyces bobili TaxID=67280 RepID=UPI00379EB581
MTRIADRDRNALDRRDDWRDSASCAGLDSRVFYAEGRGSTAQVQQAKRICSGCPVTKECADYAITNGEYYGVWGGMSQKELREKRRRFTSKSKTSMRAAA